MRAALWQYVQQLDAEATQRSGAAQGGLCDLARTIATLVEPPTVAHVKLCHICGTQICPQPLNYLVNGSPPAAAPKGLAGLLPREFCLKGAQNNHPGVHPTAQLFLGCNFNSLAALALAKGAPASPDHLQLCGFGANQAHGLAMMFGPWTDFCLHCWQQYPAEFQPEEGPLLILTHTLGPLAQHYVPGGKDWGEAAVRALFNAQDPGSRHLLTTLLAAAENAAPRAFNTLTLDDWDGLARYVARKRILVFYLLPWFVCGKSAVYESAGHARLAATDLVNQWLRQLIAWLAPRKIATLGNWAYAPDNYGPAGLAADIKARRPTWFARQFLTGTPFEECPGQDARLRFFNDPAQNWTAWPKRAGSSSLPWFHAIPEYAGKQHPSNAEAFIQFLNRS